MKYIRLSWRNGIVAIRERRRKLAMQYSRRRRKPLSRKLWLAMKKILRLESNDEENTENRKYSMRKASTNPRGGLAAAKKSSESGLSAL